MMFLLYIVLLYIFGTLAVDEQSTRLLRSLSILICITVLVLIFELLIH